MMDLTRQQKQEALDALIKKLGEGQVPVQPDSIPMEAAPMDEMTPEKAAELEKGRSPASVKPSVADLTGKSDMVAVPLESYMPAGSYVGQKLGQQVSPDVTGTQSAPEVERLAKLKEMMISGRNPSSIEDQPTIDLQKRFLKDQEKLGSEGLEYIKPVLGLTDVDESQKYIHFDPKNIRDRKVTLDRDNPSIQNMLNRSDYLISELNKLKERK